MTTTIKKIAEVANVTPYTVSVALRGRNGVSEKTRQRIEKIAQQLDYVPNFTARSLVLGKTGLVGILSAGTNNDLSVFSSQMLIEAIERKLFDKGYQAIMGLTYGLAKYEYECVQLFRARRVDAVILLSGGEKVDNIKTYNSFPCPLINVEHRFEGIECDRIRVDRSYGMFEATTYLLELGHRKIAFFGCDHDDLCSCERLIGYQKAFKEKGVECDPSMLLKIPVNTINMENIYKITLDILKTIKPTAIINTNDFGCISILKAVQDFGLEIPKDISVIGHDDMPFSAYINPALTTIRQPYAQLAAAIVEKVDKRVKNEEAEQSFENISMRAKLIIRNSTGSCKEFAK
ncbi:MAG: hypothetical protein A2Y10_16075 [Planctomycetes bacterium GWF2_41_51]|nr:MAG: hypothetical protein A2Y10_16075 [Planctomycetes bacterium GWF2_41_51]HBG25655.1 hypothetical protein [Phycisphaerales bacterium]